MPHRSPEANVTGAPGAAGTGRVVAFVALAFGLSWGVGTALAGLLSKFEVARAGQIVIEDGPCAPLAAGLFLHLLNKIPGTP